MIRFFASSLLIPVLAAPVLAQPATPEPAPASAEATPSTPAAPDVPLLEPKTQEWIIRLDPMVWWVSPSGDIRMPGASSSEVSFDRLDLDTPEFTPAGSVSINAGDFRFSFFGSGYSRDASATADSAFDLGDVSLDAGDAFDTEFEFGFYELNLGYRAWSYDFKEHTENKAEAADVSLDLYAILGARFYDLSFSIEDADGVTSSTDQFFGDVIAGARIEFNILRDFSINAQVSVGGMGDSDRSSFSVDVSLAGEWRPFTNVGVQFGWRQVAYTFEDGDGADKFEYEGALAGIFTGLVIRF